jgi:squalene-hopene/tetraprenyl-beta-curcumene cyclase
MLLAFFAGLHLRAADMPLAKPKPIRPDEPLAKSFSAEKAIAYIDAAAVFWTRDRKCVTCHTNLPYLLARPAIKGESAAMAEVRKFVENRVTELDGEEKGEPMYWETDVVLTAVTLAIHDARTTGKLQPQTRRALDRIWTLQQPDGAWNWNKCQWPPLEHDDYYGAVYAALGVGMAPDGYAKTDKAKAGLEKLRRYFKNTSPPDPHHKAMLLWASMYVDGLMTDEQRARTVKDLLTLQQDDGGWSLPSLGKWGRRDGTPNDPKAPSDGYATGFIIYVLRQANVQVKDAALQRGVAWLKANQRESGRWFTRSLNTDRAHYISNAGSCFAVLALQACDALDK